MEYVHRKCRLTIRSSRDRFAVSRVIHSPAAVRLNSGVRHVLKQSRQLEIWNRAAIELGGPNPGIGDRALAAALLAHSAVMNGGVAHAIELLSQEEFAAAISGFHYLGLPAAAQALSVPSTSTEQAIDIADRDYWRAVPSDDTLLHAFRINLLSNPDAYAPTQSGAHA